jgi:hypothetical protein
VDIYLENADGSIELLTAGCIQTGSSELTRTIMSKFYTMSNGTVACYPTENAKAEMTLSLECTYEQSLAINRKVYKGVFLLTGVRKGMTVTPESQLIRAYPTGDIRIKKILDNYYFVEIPCLFDTFRDGYIILIPPAIYPVGITIDGKTENLSAYRKQLVYIRNVKVPALVRKSIYMTSADSSEISLHMKRYDEAADKTLVIDPLVGEELEVTVTGAESTVTLRSDDEYGAVADAEIPLFLHENCIDILCTQGALKPLRLRIPIYRQAVIS